MNTFHLGGFFRMSMIAAAVAMTENVAVSADSDAPQRQPLKVIRSDESGLPPGASEADAKAYLNRIRRMIDEERDRMTSEARVYGRAQTNPEVLEEAGQRALSVATSHLDLVCRAAVDAADDTPNLYFVVLQGAVAKRDDYTAADKPVILRYLPKLPMLIRVVDRMDWYDGANEALAAGWKKARSDERNGMLGGTGSFYAVAGAKHGITDALVAIARTVQNPDAGKRNRASLFSREAAALKALVPAGGSEPMAVAKFVLKNKSKLVFDPANSVYVVKS